MGRGTASICYLALVSLLSLPCLTWAWSGMVVGVAGGDTIKVMRAHKQVKILLYGIDTPEHGQPFSKEAKQFTSDMVFGKVVEVHRMDTDRYGRTVALVALDKQLLNEELVKTGLAWVYDYDCSEMICETWKSFQLRARLDKLGLWADSNPLPPWEFRRKERKGGQ